MAEKKLSSEHRLRNADRALAAEAETMGWVVARRGDFTRARRAETPVLLAYNGAHAQELLEAIATARQLIALALRPKSS